MLNINLQELIQTISKKHVLVIGDVMLDEYIWGAVDRISPEAPVPVVSVTQREYHSGGAANVARNIHGLGGKVTLVGLTGDDASGQKLMDILSKDSGVRMLPIMEPNRMTTVKTRVIAHNQHVVRMDAEQTNPLSQDSFSQMKTHVSEILHDVDGIILQDYDKGVLSKDVIQWIMSVAKEKQIPVYVDPKKQHFSHFSGARLFKPNLAEFSKELSDFDSLEEAGTSFRDKQQFELLMVTRGKDGVSLFTKTDIHQIPTKARAVHDVSGAGDTVIATFTVFDLCSISENESALLANYAAGRVCEEVGVVPITAEKLSEFVYHHSD